MQKALEMFDLWCATFNAAVAANDGIALAALFAAASYWRDMLTLNERIETAHGPAAIADMFARRGESATSLRISAVGEARTEKIPNVGEVLGKVIRFETDSALGHGYLRLNQSSQLAFTLVTALREIKGYPEKSLTHRDSEAHRSGPDAIKNWLDK